MKKQQLTYQMTQSLPYWLYLPEDYAESDKQYPLILFLHGAGERGDDLAGVTVHGIPKKLTAGEELPFIVIAPQCPLQNWWASYTETLIAILDTVIASHRVDEQRIYLTGLSMGGFGTWWLASEYPQRFAALVPVCAPAPNIMGFPERMEKIAHLPIWAFHGDADDIVPISESEKVVTVLESLNADVQFTVYPDVDHNSWDATYDNPALYAWFLQHQLQDSES
ncbi:MAG: alpha/beta fold hydrolase [Aggregatilineales bacterium]